MNIVTITTFINTKALPFLAALAANLPRLITTGEADFQVVVTDINKLVTDFIGELGTLATAAKSA